MRAKWKIALEEKLWLRIIAIAVVMIGGWTLYVSAAYAAAAAFYRMAGFRPSGYLNVVLTSLLGLGLVLLTAFIFGRLSRPKQEAFWNKITQALERIARGDFNVSLEGSREMGPLGPFVDSINTMAQNLKQMEELRQEFISNVSHEFQSPLTSISGFAQALRSDRLTAEEKNHYLSVIEMECKRLSRLSDNLLKLTSLDSEYHPFEPQSYRLDAQLRQVALALEPQWLARSLEMEIDVPAIVIEADEELLSQVWFNLLHNAVKFTPAGGTVKASAETSDDGAGVTVFIEDTGIGIAEADRERIFERFYKADKARSRAAGGSGLGLSIVHAIVEKHRGSIRVESEPGQGTQFAVTLPLKARTERPDESGQARGEEDRRDR